MPSQRNCSSGVVTSRAAEGDVNGFWLMTFIVGAFFFCYYYYLGLVSTLLPAGAG